MREAVVFVHGVWMSGLEMGLLRRRVAACGYAIHVFRYPSILATPAENARRLAAFLDALDADVIHLVAHSLGGLVLCQLFHDFPDQRPGRVVMLGTPLRGSELARKLSRFVGSRWLLGRAGIGGLLGDGPGWPRSRPLAMIAGSRGVLGMGLLVLGRIPQPNDGTVAVVETEGPAVTEHLTVPYGHFGMLFARPVADAVCRYLRAGRLVD
jgi:pimeloyl-ACP methyl ester carboxylesterase